MADYRKASFILDEDPFSRSRETLHIDTDGSFCIQTDTEITAITESAKAERDENTFGGTRFRKKTEQTKIASIPLPIYFDLQERGIIDDERAFAAWLASDEGAPFRTHWMTS